MISVAYQRGGLHKIQLAAYFDLRYAAKVRMQNFAVVAVTDHDHLQLCFR